MIGFHGDGLVGTSQPRLPCWLISLARRVLRSPLLKDTRALVLSESECLFQGVSSNPLTRERARRLGQLPLINVSVSSTCSIRRLLFPRLVRSPSSALPGVD